MTEEKEIQDSPVNGSVPRDYKFVDPHTLLVEVEDQDGEVWSETYEFVEAEKVSE